MLHDPSLCKRVAKRLCRAERLDWEEDGLHLAQIVLDAERRLIAQIDSRQTVGPDDSIGWEMAVMAVAHPTVRNYAQTHGRLAGRPRSQRPLDASRDRIHAAAAEPR